MLADIYRPHISGVTLYIAENKRVLEDLGHEVTVFTFGVPDPSDEPGVVRSPGLPITHEKYYLNIRYSPAAKQKLLRMDVVHCHHPFISGRIALNYCRPVHIPIVFTNHTRYDLYLKSYLPIIPGLFGDAFLQVYMQSFCKSVDAVISPSEGMKGVLEDLGVNTPIQVIPNGVDLSSFAGDVVPFPRVDYGYSPEDILFIYSGRLAPEKDLPFLLRCFAQLAAHHPKARLILAGTGPDTGDLQLEAKELGLEETVQFIGLVDYVNMPRLLAMSDVFVTASSSEVHPLSVIEAMACGLPVIGIISPGISDTVKDGVTGELTVLDEKAFTSKMARMITDPEYRKHLGAAARESIRFCDLHTTARQVESLYQELLNHSQAEKHGFRYSINKITGRLRS
jgi:glycosyltransferase involved in cell wall biosynthesis